MLSFFLEVQDREAKSAAHFAALSKLSADKRLILDDHLARETFNEKLRLDDGQHANVCEAIDRCVVVCMYFVKFQSTCRRVINHWLHI